MALAGLADRTLGEGRNTIRAFFFIVTKRWRYLYCKWGRTGIKVCAVAQPAQA